MSERISCPLRDSLALNKVANKYGDSSPLLVRTICLVLSPGYINNEQSLYRCVETFHYKEISKRMLILVSEFYTTTLPSNTSSGCLLMKRSDG
jgi:hypothetical protein